jgi:GDSL-like lipase/acylhydrolase family protein
MPDPRPCIDHPDVVAFKHELPNFARALNSQRKIKIVTIGSSSTAGVDDGVIPFPARLELALRKRYFGRMIDVLNRGIGGQEALDELSRFECDVIAEAPALVIWQVGTNAVFRSVDYNPQEVEEAIAAGLGILTALPMDVVLMDLQYTRVMVDDIDLSEKMEARISFRADQAKVNLFRRWDLMRTWCLQDKVPLVDLDDGGRLHTSEWATGCVARALDASIGSAPKMPVYVPSPP